jgi:O-antigen ligase
VIRPRLLEIWPAALAVLVAAMWPVSAQAVHPIVMPVLVVGTIAAALIVQRPDWGLAIALSLAPLTNFIVGGTKPLQLLLPGLAVGLLLYGLLTTRGERRPRGPGVAAALTVLMGTFVASSMLALQPSESVNRLFALLTAAALFYAVSHICQTPRQLRVVLGGAVVGLAVAGLHGQMQLLVGQLSEAGVVIGGEIVGRIQGSFGHPNQYAGYLAALIPVGATLALTHGVPRGLRSLSAAACLVAVWPLMSSYTRGALGGLVVGALVWLAVVRPRAAALAAVGVVVFGVGFAPSALQERLSSDAGGDVQLRADLWGAAIQIAGERPILGVGLNNFDVGYGRLPSTLATGSQRRLLHQDQVLLPPHANNMYLTILAEEGVIGLVVFLVFLGTGLAVSYRATKLRDPTGRAVGLGLGAALLVVAVHSMLDYTLTGELSQPLFALLGVATVFVARERRDEPAATAAAGR